MVMRAKNILDQVLRDATTMTAHNFTRFQVQFSHSPPP